MRVAALFSTLVVLSGCGTTAGEVLKDAAKSTLPAVISAAADHFRKEAASKGIEIDENLAACFPVSEFVEEHTDVELPNLVMMCTVPVLD